MRLKRFLSFINEAKTSKPIEVVWIHGLPGSGKTTLAKKWIDKGYVNFDDSVSEIPVISSLKSGKSVVISSPFFEDYFITTRCHNALKRELNKMNNVKVTEIWFENDPDQCMKNLQVREGERLSRFFDIIPSFSKSYKIPKGAETVPVFRGKSKN